MRRGDEVWTFVLIKVTALTKAPNIATHCDSGRRTTTVYTPLFSTLFLFSLAWQHYTPTHSLTRSYPVIFFLRAPFQSTTFVVARTCTMVLRWHRDLLPQHVLHRCPCPLLGTVNAHMPVKTAGAPSTSNIFLSTPPKES